MFQMKMLISESLITSFFDSEDIVKKKQEKTLICNCAIDQHTHLSSDNNRVGA